MLASQLYVYFHWGGVADVKQWKYNSLQSTLDICLMVSLAIY